MCDICGARLDPADMTATGYHAALLETAARRMASVLALLLLAVLGCGKTPTAPRPCTAATATFVDTAWVTAPNGQRVVAAVKYECR